MNYKISKNNYVVYKSNGGNVVGRWGCFEFGFGKDVKYELV